MTKLKLLLVLLFGSILLACTETKDRPEPDLPPDVPVQPTQITILNTPLPIYETFNVTTGPADHTTGTGGGYDFFNPAYKPLATCAADDDADPLTCTHDIEDRNGNPITLVDTLSSFYYPTCCFFNTFPTDVTHPAYNPNLTGQQRRPPLETPPSYDDGLDYRLKVANNRMAISDARFTIGQILSDLTSPNAVDRKINTSGNTPGANVVTGGWGELDLSQPYRISYCLMDNGAVVGGGGGSGNLEVYVDNNSGGSQVESFHGQLSLLLRETTTSFARGNRVVVEVPGQARQVDNNGNLVGDVLALSQNLTGTKRSFIQLRVSSGTYAVISDLVIEYQSDRTVTQLVTDLPCTTDTAFWIDPPPANIRLTPNDSQLGVAWNLYSGATSFEVAYNTTDSLTGATIVNVPGGTSVGTTITGLVNGTTYYVFVRANINAENSGYSSSVSAVVNPPPVAPNTPTGLMVAPLDGQVGVVWDATTFASDYDVAYNTINDPDIADGATEITDIATLGTTIPSLSNGTQYYVFVRAKNGIGPSAYSAGKLATPTASVAGVWTGANLDLVAGAGNAPVGSLTENFSTDVTFDVAGGNAATAVHRIFFAYQQITGDFKLVARFTSASANPAFGTVNNNAYRFGLMMMENISVPADYANLARWADTGYFVETTTPTYTGSTARKLTSGSATRSRENVAQVQGNLLRLSRTGTALEASFSIDNGVTYNAVASGVFAGTAIPDTWYLGFYGTQHATGGTGTYVFDDIQLFQ